eukprot:365293-Chlamydomonas_euryale.AAC.2
MPRRLALVLHHLLLTKRLNVTDHASKLPAATALLLMKVVEVGALADCLAEADLGLADLTFDLGSDVQAQRCGRKGVDVKAWALWPTYLTIGNAV